MLQKIETFLAGNKVFFLGLLGSIGTAISAFIGQTVNLEVLALAVVIAGLSYAAKTLTGNVASLIGVLGSSVATIYTAVVNHGAVNWQQLFITAIAATLAVVSGGASSTTVVTPPVPPVTPSANTTSTAKN
jgi:hypothetical protein